MRSCTCAYSRVRAYPCSAKAAPTSAHTPSPSDAISPARVCREAITIRFRYDRLLALSQARMMPVAINGGQSCAPPLPTPSPNVHALRPEVGRREYSEYSRAAQRPAAGRPRAPARVRVRAAGWVCRRSIHSRACRPPAPPRGTCERVTQGCAVRCVLPVACCMLPVACCMLPVACSRYAGLDRLALDVARLLVATVNNGTVQCNSALYEQYVHARPPAAVNARTHARTCTQPWEWMGPSPLGCPRELCRASRGCGGKPGEPLPACTPP
jgi:hypothetical protein